MEGVGPSRLYFLTWVTCMGISFLIYSLKQGLSASALLTFKPGYLLWEEAVSRAVWDVQQHPWPLPSMIAASVRVTHPHTQSVSSANCPLRNKVTPS